MADNKMNLKCSNCSSSGFYVQDGLYFCEECGVQYESLQQMEVEFRFNDNKHTVKFAKSKPKQDKTLRLTSFEEYNHILKGFVDEILTIEDIPNFKATCLQLWISYLQQSEAAFFDKEKMATPKLYAVYRKADAQILYNKPPKQKKKYPRKKKVSQLPFETNKQRRKKMRQSEKIISSQLSESLKSESWNSSMLANLSIDTIRSDHEDFELDVDFSRPAKDLRRKILKAEADEDNQDRSCAYRDLNINEAAYILDSNTLLCIIYCALNICGSKIQLGDLIRMARECYLSFYKCKQLLPEEVLENKTDPSFTEYQRYLLVNHLNLCQKITYFARIIPDLPASLKIPNLIQLTERYITEMQLPDELKDYVARLLIMFPPEMKFYEKCTLIPNYEGRAMAYIILTLKLLFGLDGYREEEMSRSAKKINKRIVKHNLGKKIFVFKDWMEYIEYRQLILGKFSHSALYHYTNSIDKPYFAYNIMLNALGSQTRKREVQTKHKRDLFRLQSKANAQEMLTQLMQNHDEDDAERFITSYTFPWSFTPFTDNFKHILSHEKRFEYRSIVTADFTKDSCEALMKPQTLVNSFKNIGFKLKTKKSTFPKSFVFKKARFYKEHISYNDLSKIKHKLDFDKMTEKQWRDDLKKRQNLEEKYKEEDLLEYHEKEMKRVLEKRAYWRQKIKSKKLESKKRNNITDEASEIENDEPRDLKEPNIFSDSESDSEDDNACDEIDYNVSEHPDHKEILNSQERADADENFTLIIPDYNLWHRKLFTGMVRPKKEEPEIEKLPKNFIWLLKFAASILLQHPGSLLQELIIIEHYFIHIYQPVELFENAILKQELHRPTGKRW